MNKKGINIIFAAGLITTAIFSTGCSKNTESDVVKTGNVNQSLPDLNKNTSVNAPSLPPANVANGTPTPNISGSTPTPGVNNSNDRTVANQKPPAAVKAPTPIIGSGGEDLLLFTQVRAALSADQALNYVIIDVKEGNVTLSGNVANKDLKAKAGQLAQAVKGVKSVKNNLNVS